MIGTRSDSIYSSKSTSIERQVFYLNLLFHFNAPNAFFAHSLSNIARKSIWIFKDSERSVPSSQLSFDGEDDDEDGGKSLDAEAERLELERLAKEQLEKAKVSLSL